MLCAPLNAIGLTSLASRFPLGDVEHDRCRSLVEKLLNELYERMRILKACPGVEPSDLEEFSIALDAPIYPPRPYLLAFSPASDFHSGHAGPPLRSLEVCLLGVESGRGDGKGGHSYRRPPVGGAHADRRGDGGSTQRGSRTR